MVSEVPRLSPSIAHHLATDSPRMAWAAHRLLGNCFELTPEQIAIRERGSALHNMVLEGGHKVERVDVKTWQSSAAKAQRDQARADGFIPLKAADYDALTEAADNIRHEAKRKLGVLFEEGEAERRYEWTEAAEEGDVDCSGVIDWSHENLVLDLKTTTGSVAPEVCAAALIRSAGVVQDCAYRVAYAQRFPEVEGRIEVVFLFAQSKPPYMVQPYHCGGDMRHIGESRWLRAVETWQRCLAMGTGAECWPDHGDGVLELNAPGWALAQELSADLAAEMEG